MLFIFQFFLSYKICNLQVLRPTEKFSTDIQDGKEQKNVEKNKYGNDVSADASLSSIVKSNEDDIGKKSETAATSASTFRIAEKVKETANENEKVPIEDFSQLRIDINIESSMENVPSTGNVLSPSIRIPALISVKLSPLEIFRAALDSVGVHNWSLFA